MPILHAEWDVREVTQFLDAFAIQQLPFATALALTRLGQKIQKAERAKMNQVFDRPTPFTLNSLFLKPATKQNAQVTVWFKDFAPKGNPAGKYLLPEVFGGPRSHFRFEGALRAAGVLGSSEYAIPADGTPRDAYGNVVRGIYSRVLSDLGAQRDAAQNSKGDARYFVGTVSGTKGIFQARGYGPSGNLRMLFVITGKAPTYSKRFDFFGVADRIGKEDYQAEFQAALTEALKTAKG